MKAMNNDTDNQNHIEPYRLLFPLGIFIGILGVLLWLLFQFGWIRFYPRAAHGNLMFFGLLWSFVAGFLMTAIPKMTSTKPAQILEISAAVSLSFIQLVLNIRNLTDASVALYLLQNLFLVFFIVRRFLVHRQIPFFGFIFLPMAFIQSFIGISLFWIGSFDKNLILLFCGEAFILNLIVGLGSRLIPVISRLPNALLPTEKTKFKLKLWPLFAFILINTGYWIELFGLKDLGLAVKIIGLAIAMIKLFRIFTKPVTWSYVGISLKISVLMLLVGNFLNFSFLNYSLAGLHMIYIGGFTLITLMIATRVMLAHGGQTLEYEVSAPRIAWVSAMILLSAILRWLAGVQITSLFLSISVLFFITAVVTWSVQFIKILNSAYKKQN